MVKFSAIAALSLNVHSYILSLTVFLLLVVVTCGVVVTAVVAVTCVIVVTAVVAVTCVVVVTAVVAVTLI